MRPILPALLLPLALVACGSSLNARAVTATSMLDAAPHEVYGDRERLEYGKTQQVRLPARVAVADVTPAYTADGSWRGEGATRARRTALQDRLTDDPERFSDVVSLLGIDEHVYGEASRDDLRARAAVHQADLVLAWETRERVEEGHTFGALFKVLLLPMLFLETEENRVHLDVRAVVMDARNGLRYATFDDHRTATVVARVGTERELVATSLRSLFDDAVAKLRDEVGRKLGALDGSGGTD